MFLSFFLFDGGKLLRNVFMVCMDAIPPFLSSFHTSTTIHTYIYPKRTLTDPFQSRPMILITIENNPRRV